MIRYLPSLIIVKRELIVSLRRFRTLLLVVTLLGAAAMLAVMSWPVGAVPVQSFGMMSQQIVLRLSLLMFLGCILCVPGLAAATIVSEREQDTLDQLYLTLVRPSGVVAAKAFNTAGVYLLLVFATLPVFATVMFGVGLDWQQILYLFVFLFMCALSCAMIGILCSTLFRRTFLAVVASYLFAVAIMVGGPMYFGRFLRAVFTGQLGYLLQIWDRYPQDDWTSALSPLRTLSAIHTEATGYFFVAVLVHVVFCAICFVIAIRLLRRQTEPRAISTEKSIDDPRILRARRSQFPFYLIDPLRRKPLIDDGRNPMYVREVRWGLFNRGTVLVRIFYSVFTVSLFGALMVATVPPGGAGRAALGWYAIMMMLMAGISSILMANSFAKEYELGNFDMLRMTLLDAGSIVAGKGVAGFLSVAPAMLAVMLASTPIVFWHREAMGEIGAGMLTMCVCVILCIAIGLAISLHARKTNVALVLGLAAAFFLFAFPRIVSEILDVGFISNFTLIFGYRANLAKGSAGLAGWCVSLAIHSMMAVSVLAYTVVLLRNFRMQDR